MKKLLAIFFAAAVVLLATAPAFAHGHGGGHEMGLGRHTPQYGEPNVQEYPVCKMEDCTLNAMHTHMGDTQNYVGHRYNDGHDYHGYCNVEDCALSGYHEHDGVYCFGHARNDGHDYHSYCDFVDCAVTGYHEHNGVYCFGHVWNDGHSIHGGTRLHHA